MVGVVRKATILMAAALAAALLLAAADQFSGDRRTDDGPSDPEVVAAVDVVSSLKSKLGLRADADVRIATVMQRAAAANSPSLEGGGRGVGDALDSPDALELTIELSDSPTTYTLNLRQHSNRAPDMFVRVYGANGEYEDRAPGPVRTYRGEIIDTATGAITGEVAGSINEDGQLRGRLMLTGEDEQWIEPVKRDNGAAAEHILYKATDIKLDRPFTCGVSGEASRHQGIQAPREEQNAAISAPLMPRSLDASMPSSETFDLHCANIGCDVDVEYFQNFASVEEAQQRIEDIINIANIQYEHQVQITHRIALIVIRTEEPDPYDGFPSADLTFLIWQNEFPEVDWDVVHLFTGKDLGENIFGFANINGICQESFRASAVVSFVALVRAIPLTEHELGHNWGAIHCTCPGGTMRPALPTNSDFRNFSEGSIQLIEAYRDTRSCIEFCDTLEITRTGLPFMDDFEETTLSTERWQFFDTTTVSSAAESEPSGTQSALIPADGILGSSAINGTDFFAIDLEYAYQLAPNSSPSSELLMEVFGKGYYWSPISTHTSSTPDFEHFSIRIFSGLTDFKDFRVRFHANGGDWFIDDVRMTPIPFNPCPEDCRNQDGVVDIDDLLELIIQIGDAGGTCDVAPRFPDGDFGNDDVNIDDLLAVITAFGPCADR